MSCRCSKRCRRSLRMERTRELLAAAEARENRGRSPAFNSRCLATFAFALAPKLLPFLPVQPFGVGLFRTGLGNRRLIGPCRLRRDGGFGGRRGGRGCLSETDSDSSGCGEGRERNDAE